MRKSILAIVSFACSTVSFAQTLEKSAAYTPKSLTKDSYVGNVFYDASTKNTSLYYVEKDIVKTNFKTYVFDKDLNFIKEDVETYTLTDGNPDIASAKTKFTWFNFKKESFNQQFVSISQGVGGKIIARQVNVTYVYNWFLGQYVPVYKPSPVVSIKSETDDKLYLYTGVINAETGDAYIIVGQKSPKGSDENLGEVRNFQIVKISYNLQVEYLEEFSFDYNMAISYNTVIYNPGAEPYTDGQYRDVNNGKWHIVFSPIKTLIGKKTVNPKAGESMMAVIASNGKLLSKVNYDAPAAGWDIEDIAISNDGKDVYFYGPAIADKYINQVIPTNSPLTLRTEDKKVKYKDFQILKLTDNKFSYIKTTNLDEFERKLKNPPSQKKSPDYRGKKFEKSFAMIASNGELYIGGQNFERVNKVDPISGTSEIEIKYTDLILFHFDKEGELKAQYGVRRDKNNKHSRANLTPQYLYESPQSGNVYWVYGEIQGLRRGFEVGGFASEFGHGTLAKKKLLYYPAVARIDAKNGNIGDFLFLGTNEKGKPEYYTNPNLPQILSADGEKLIFVGEDKKGKEIWLAKVNID